MRHLREVAAGAALTLVAACGSVNTQGSFPPQAIPPERAFEFAYSGCDLGNVENLFDVQNGVGHIALSVAAVKNDAPQVVDAVSNGDLVYANQPRVEPYDPSLPTSKSVDVVQWENSAVQTGQAVMDIDMKKLDKEHTLAFNIFVSAYKQEYPPARHHLTKTALFYCGKAEVAGNSKGFSLTQIGSPDTRQPKTSSKIIDYPPS